MSTLIGTSPDQVPVNGMLGDMAFQNKVAVTIGTLTSTNTTSTDLPTYSAEFITTATWTSTGWTGDNTTGWVNGASNVSPLSYPTAAVVSTKYQIAYTVVRSAGSFTLAFGGQSTAGITATGAFGPTATTTGNLVITPTATFVGTIIVSIKSLTAVSTPVIVLKDSTNTVRFEARINTASSNTFLGLNSGSYNTTGVQNSAMGMQALLNNTTGNYNSAVGQGALQSNTTGGSNSAVGVSALLNNTTGGNNSAVGGNALFSNTAGGSNSAVGQGALQSNTTGVQNSAVGMYALYDVRPTSKAITAFADYSATVAGTVKATSVAHGLTGITTKLISGTTNYNASYSVTVIDVDNFYFTATWVATQTGWWSISTEGNNNTALGYNTGRGITTGSGNTIVGANVAGLAAGLTNNIILANGTGSIRVQSNATTITFADVIMPQQATTAAAPAYVKGGMYFDTTLNKMRIGGATAWETVTSSI